MKTLPWIILLACHGHLYLLLFCNYVCFINWKSVSGFLCHFRNRARMVLLLIPRFRKNGSFFYLFLFMVSVTILIKHSGYQTEYNIFLWLAIVWIKTDFRFDFVGNISLYNLLFIAEYNFIHLIARVFYINSLGAWCYGGLLWMFILRRYR